MPDDYAGNAAAPHAISEFEVEDNLDDLLQGRLAQKLSIVVVTPRAEVAAGRADEITAPGLLGELGLLPGHVPLLAALRAGVLVWRLAGERQVLAIGPGYVELVGARVTILTDESASPQTIDLAAVRAEAARAEAALATVSGEDEAVRRRLQAELAWANARAAAVNAM